MTTIAAGAASAFSIKCLWLTDETTEENGATEIILQSFMDEELGNSLMNSGAFEQREIGDINIDPAPHPDAIKTTMPAGSLDAGQRHALSSRRGQ